MNLFPSSHFPGGRPRRRDGVALVIILAFVVILTGVIIAFFSRAIANRSISNASANETKVDLVAQGAADSIVGYLQQEIALCSSTTSIPTSTGTSVVYAPRSNVSMLPQISGTTASATGLPPNLLKRSAYSAPFFSANSANAAPGSIPGAAINVSSTTPSLNGRSVSLARWNSHYLLPLLSSTDATPVTTGSTAFTPPDWVLVTRSGSSPTVFSPNMVTSATNGTSVVGRYAYAIYHEGGLLDANVAGFPIGSGSAAVVPGGAYKPALAYADLTQLPGGLTSAQVDELVAWRNCASALTSGSFQSPGFTQTSGSSYFNFVMSNPSGFLRVSSTALNNNGVMSQTAGQSDRMFESRQELIAFMQKGLGLSGTSLNVLNYLATFTRGIDAPSIAPDPTRPKVLETGSGGNNVYPSTGSLEFADSANLPNTPINPNFLTLTASNAFLHNNGRTAVAGQPLVNQRFALSRLAWLTYGGPSAYRNLNNPSASGSDADIWALEHTYGVSPSYLALGTSNNISEYFGLVWQADKSKAIPSGFHDGTFKWFYSGHNSKNGVPGTLALSNSAGPISRLGEIADLGPNARDPDFFELLKASVAAGSKAKGSINLTGTGAASLQATDPYLIQTQRDQSLDYAIIQLGANIINQSSCDGYSTRIVFNDGGTAHEFRGVINQPYLYRVVTGDMKLRNEITSLSGTDSGPETSGTIADTGVALLMQTPTIWNPHDLNAPVGSPAPQNFRMVVDSTQPEQQDTSGLKLGYGKFAPYGTNATAKLASTAATTSTTACPAFSYAPKGQGVLISTLVNSSNPVALTYANNYLTFSGTNPALFREPTILARPNLPSGSNLAINALSNDYTNVENSSGQTSYQTSGAGGNGFIAESSNPLNLQGAVTSATTRYIGIPIGLYPVAWNITNGSINNYFRSWFAAVNVVNSGGPFVTYRMQYQDQAGNWITYDEKYVHVNTLFLQTPFNAGSTGNLFNTTPLPKNIGSGGIWESFTDPRTARFCSIDGRNLGTADNTPGATNAAEWLDPQNDVLRTERPDFNSGYGMSDDRNKAGGIEFEALADAGWTLDPTANTFLRQGLLSQNSPSIIDNGLRFVGDSLAVQGGGHSQYYADPDGVVRNGMSAYVTGSTGSSPAPASTIVGLPMATAYNPSAPTPLQGQSRPYMLHRPFRSVAELGYVFSGTPWKNIDFFTPQSGDAPLLDAFTVNEPPVESAGPDELVAGTVNLNTTQEPVLQAVLAGAYAGESPADGATAHPFTPTEANAILSATNSLIARTASTATGQGPLDNVSDLVGRWVSTTGTYSGPSADLTSIYSTVYGVGVMENIQRFREAFIRPLAAVGNTRVWNLMIDLVAQTGRYPQSTTNPANFVVDGEQRYWVHVAIDRFTGQVLDKQVEIVRQ